VLSNEKSVEVSDTTKHHSSNAVGYKIKINV